MITQNWRACVVCREGCTPFMVKVGITAAHAQQSLALTQCSVHDRSLWRDDLG